MGIATDYARFTGQPTEKIIFDWTIRQYVSCIAIDVGRSDPIEPGIDCGSLPEKMPSGKERAHVDRKGDGFYTIAELLRKHGPMRIKELRAETGYGKSRIHNILWRNKKYFEKVHDENDGRIVLYSLSELGAALKV